MLLLGFGCYNYGYCWVCVCVEDGRGAKAPDLPHKLAVTPVDGVCSVAIG